MHLQRYDSSKKNQWNDFVKTSKNGFFMFDRDYMEYHADRFEDHSLMIYNESGKLMAIFPANHKDNILYSHQGLTFGGLLYGKKMRTPEMIDVMDAVLAYARENGFEKIVYKAIPYFYHKQPAQEDLYAIFRAGGQCFRVDVSSTIHNFGERYSFSSSRKSGLKKARDNKLCVSPSDDFLTFFEVMNDLLNDKYDTQATHSAEELKLLADRFPNNIKLYAVSDHNNNDMIAGIIIYETPTTAHTQYIAASEKGKETGALDLILDYLINERYKGKSFFDFGISTEQNGHVLNTKLIDQKEGTGARATIHQQFEIIL